MINHGGHGGHGVKKRLWLVQGFNFMRHKVGDTFLAFTESEARELFRSQYGCPASRVEVVR
jgi:hypothetical protein